MELVIAFAGIQVYFGHHLRPASVSVPLGLALLSSIRYADLKRTLPGIKALYVGFMWATAMVLVPHFASSDVHGATLEAPLLRTFASTALIFAAMSNAMDILDVDEDCAAAVPTIPALLGISHGRGRFLVFLIKVCFFFN